VQTECLIQIEALLDECDELELVVVRRECQLRLGRAVRFADEKRRKRADRHNRCLLSMLAVDERLRLVPTDQGGGRLLYTTQYLARHLKALGEVSLTTIIEEFGGWERAMNESGLAARTQPRLLRTKGHKKHKDGHWTNERGILGVAQALEENIGLKLSTDGYEDIREALGGKGPQYKTILAKAKAAGIPAPVWDNVHVLAYRLILANAELYPRAYPEALRKHRRGELEIRGAA
jgi:hypothetical protein